MTIALGVGPFAYTAASNPATHTFGVTGLTAGRAFLLFMEVFDATHSITAASVGSDTLTVDSTIVRKAGLSNVYMQVAYIPSMTVSGSQTVSFSNGSTAAFADAWAVELTGVASSSILDVIQTSTTGSGTLTTVGDHDAVLMFACNPSAPAAPSGYTLVTVGSNVEACNGAYKLDITPAGAQSLTMGGVWIAVGIKIASSGSTGTIASTQGLNTTAQSGTVAVSGTEAATQGLNTTAQAGTVAISGTAAITQAKNTTAQAGTVAISGTEAATQGLNTTAQAGTVAISGTEAATQGANTTAQAGTVAVSGTIADTQQPNVAALAGAVGNVSTGTIATTQGANTSAASGTVGIAGTEATTQAPNTTAQAGAVGIAGAASVAQSANVAALVGGVLASGAIAVAQAPNTASLTGGILGSLVSDPRYLVKATARSYLLAGTVRNYLVKGSARNYSIKA